MRSFSSHAPRIKKVDGPMIWFSISPETADPCKRAGIVERANVTPLLPQENHEYKMRLFPHLLNFAASCAGEIVILVRSTELSTSTANES